MSTAGSERVFAGAIPTIYDKHLVPLLFAPYAVDLAERLVARSPDRVLELACGTGVVTRALASALPARTAIVATDLNQPMLDHARAAGTARPVEWRQADAMQLPFPDRAFDAVVCQFGFMFFPEKPRAFAEARRVLRRGGVLIFNVWDRLADNEIFDTVTTALAPWFPGSAPSFFARTPYGYHERAQIERDIVAGGFTAPAEITTLAHRSRAASARDAAVACCQGTPLRNEIEAVDKARLEEATDLAAAAIARRFGGGPVDAKMQAHVVTVES